MNQYKADFTNNLPIHFVAGMPRSCSTLFMNFLGQNPKFHVTPTNALSVLLNNIKDNWQKMPAFQAQGLWDNILPRINNVMLGTIRSFYAQEFMQGKLVFDKDRGWMSPKAIKMMEEILQREIRVIVTVRDPRAVFASFENLRNKSPLTDPPPFDAFKEETQLGRAQLMFSPNGVIGSWINAFREVRDTELATRMIIVPFNNLLKNPIITINSVYEALGLLPFEHNPNNVEQITYEDDTRHGFRGLHDIKSKIEPPKNEKPWEGILTPQIIHGIETDFPDIIALGAIGQAADVPAPVTNQTSLNVNNEKSVPSSNYYRTNP